MTNILDIEASGFGPDSYPIEIGAVLQSGEQYCTLIHPAADWMHWDACAEKVHGVSRELLLKHGKPINQVAIELNDFIGNNTIYSDCWGVDQPWLTKLFYAAAINQKFRLSDLECILKEPQMAIWHQTKKQVQAESNLKRHRASSDAKVIQLTYLRSKAYYQKALARDPVHPAYQINQSASTQASAQLVKSH